MKNNNEVIRYGIILFIITAVCVGLVSYVFQFTDPIIKKEKIIKDDNARKEILTSAEKFEKVEGDFTMDKNPSSIIKEVYKGLDKNGDVVGYTVKTLPKGYGGEIEVITGIDLKEKKVTGIELGSMNETPGLGAKSKDEPFKGQYKGKNAEKLEVVKNEETTPEDNKIEAISGATITSNAVTKGVNESINLFNSELK